MNVSSTLAALAAHTITPEEAKNQLADLPEEIVRHRLDGILAALAHGSISVAEAGRQIIAEPTVRRQYHIWIAGHQSAYATVSADKVDRRGGRFIFTDTTSAEALVAGGSLVVGDFSDNIGYTMVPKKPKPPGDAKNEGPVSAILAGSSRPVDAAGLGPLHISRIKDVPGVRDLPRVDVGDFVSFVMLHDEKTRLNGELAATEDAIDDLSEKVREFMQSHHVVQLAAGSTVVSHNADTGHLRVEQFK